MVVQHNLSAMNANRYLGINNSKLSKSLEKLSSGYAINRAGDNAAGLAVSEKMRSQIAGMTQGVKNAQDGISMVQTFEGALTETDSILQRMKTLADQMANGTYDDPVDRSAAQLEFDQLNDELNQIADTDFNGVICLNGGTMADGLEAVDGKFDYANKDGQIADKKAAIEKQIADVKATTPNDIFQAKDDAGADVWNAVDDTKYDDTAAKGPWKDLGLDNTAKNVDISFEATVAADGKVSYAAVAGKAYDADGNVVKELTKEDLTKAGITATAANKTGATGYGGFDVKSTTNTNAIANAIFDATSVNTLDRLTLNFTGPADAAKAPTNFGLADVYAADGTAGDLATISKGENVTAVGNVKVSSTLTDATMTEDIAKVLEHLNGSEWTLTGTASMNNGNVPAANIACNKATLTAGAQTINGVDCFITNAADGKVIISTNNAGAAGQEILTIEGLTMSTTAATADATKNAAKFTIAYDKAFYPAAGATPDVNAVESEIDASAIDNKVAALEKQLADLDAEGVSVSNAHGNGDIPMTYTETITLQTGARSKDAVEFTFAYTSGGIGDLKDNMNCSARADGLNTESLSLATAKDANFAIDKIDHAINKVSMVRATFGAIQNRLEHKIDNLNVSIENLTSAESQIRDTNMPQEMMNFTKQQILAQASQSMLAQANQLPQGVLSLLQ